MGTLWQLDKIKIPELELIWDVEEYRITMVGQSNIPITYANEWQGIHGDRKNKNEQLQ